jgi:uncharacterized protein (DUF885 family)
MRWFRILLTLFLLPWLPTAFAQTPTKPSSPSASLGALLDEEWDYEMRSSPETATSYGDNRFNDRLSDFSPEFFAGDVQQDQAFLAKFVAISASGLSEQDQLNRSLMIRRLQNDIEGARFKPWEMQIDQFNGIHLSYGGLPSLCPFQTVKDYENYIARLHQLPRVFDQVIVNSRQGIRDKLMPPKFLLEQVVPQARSVADNVSESNPFAQPVAKFPASIGAADQERLRKEVMAAVRDDVAPAYGKFADFVEKDYAPHGRMDVGVWALPDGDALYRYNIRNLTTTDLTPEQIHELGLKQVAEIEGEMLVVARKLGFKDIASLNEHIHADHSLYATSSQQVLGLYQKYADQMYAKLPQLFGTLPKNKLIVVPMEEFREKAGVPADYTSGSPLTGRPGRINVNMYDPEHRLTLNIEAIAYHEGVPGHHLQISIGEEIPSLPAFRQHADYTAFVEGWALYSERLGKEVGFYQDPYSDYGRLENEMWRAVRLVVDTGVHSKHWSRQQMVDYFHRYTAMDEPNIQTEVDRYIAWPGQALAYKLGQLRILEMRERAKKELGAGFDIRAFHDEVLGASALPLDVFEKRMTAWITTQHASEPKH